MWSRIPKRTNPSNFSEQIQHFKFLKNEQSNSYILFKRRFVDSFRFESRKKTEYSSYPTLSTVTLSMLNIITYHVKHSCIFV